MEWLSSIRLSAIVLIKNILHKFYFHRSICLKVTRFPTDVQNIFIYKDIQNTFFIFLNKNVHPTNYVCNVCKQNCLCSLHDDYFVCCRNYYTAGNRHWNNPQKINLRKIQYFSSIPCIPFLSLGCKCYEVSSSSMIVWIRSRLSQDSCIKYCSCTGLIHITIG